VTNVNVRNLGGRRLTLKTRPQPKARGARRKRKDGGPEAVEVPGVTLGHAGMTNSTESSEREKDGRTLCEGTPPSRREHPERGGKKGCGNVKLECRGVGGVGGVECQSVGFALTPLTLLDAVR
jgi:hypothetical protein